MPDICDLKRGLKISLTDDDYKDYQNGNLSDDFYARRADGSIANRVGISPLDNNNENRVPSGEIDARSAAKAAKDALILATLVGGVVYGIKKIWNRHKDKKKKAETQIAEQRKAQVKLQKEESAKRPIESEGTMLSTKTARAYDAERKSLTQEEANQEWMKIIFGMAEIADGREKVLEGVQNLSNAGIVDRAALLEKLSDSKALEDFNIYLKNNPQLVTQNQTILSSIFGRSFIADGQYVPLTISDIKRQLRTETIQEG